MGEVVEDGGVVEDGAVVGEAVFEAVEVFPEVQPVNRVVSSIISVRINVIVFFKIKSSFLLAAYKLHYS